METLKDLMSDSDKLRMLASWFDVQDAKKAALGEATSDEVQRDLRDMADAWEEIERGVDRLTELFEVQLMPKLTVMQLENAALKAKVAELQIKLLSYQTAAGG